MTFDRLPRWWHAATIDFQESTDRSPSFPYYRFTAEAKFLNTPPYISSKGTFRAGKGKRANISREKERVPREQKWYDTNLLLCGTVNNGGRYNSDRQQYRRGIIRVPSIDAICNRAVRSWRPDLVSVSTIIRGESAITPRRLLSPTVSPSSPIIDNLLRGFHLNKARFDPARFRFYPPV